MIDVFHSVCTIAIRNWSAPGMTSSAVGGAFTAAGAAVSTLPPVEVRKVAPK